MIDNVNIGSQGLKSVDQTPSAKVTKDLTKGSHQVTRSEVSDVAEVSTAGKGYAHYMSVAKALPDMREDVVARAREGIRSKIPYPPLDVVHGVAKLVGSAISKVE